MPEPTRTFEEPMFTSSALPRIRMRVANSLSYLGRLEFDIFQAAHVERHFFAESAEGRIRCQLILQFEGWLPGSDEVYRWPTPNPIELAGETYQHNIFIFSQAAAIEAAPDAEVAHTVRFLAEQGLTADDELIMARFARIVGDERQHELIIFYIENLRDLGPGMAEMAQDGDLLPAYAHLEAPLFERAYQHFELLNPN